jgi:2-hydroxy-3-oxopropionate reductase
MAVNLVKAGFDVVGYNRSRPALDRLVAAGGRAVTSLRAVVEDADAVLTMLPDSPDVASVILEAEGVLECAQPGLLLVDMSTIRPELARRIATAGAESGVHVLDAPVSGGEEAAVSGSLSIMVGGAAGDVDRARPIFAALGSTIVHVGESGSGQIVKAANQLLVGGQLELVAEALIFLEANGVDARPAIEVLNGGLAGSAVLARKAPNMLQRSFNPGFRVALHHKDLGILLESAREAGVVLPLGALVGQLMGSLNSQGYGGLDHSALVKLVELLSSRKSC